MFPLADGSAKDKLNNYANKLIELMISLCWIAFGWGVATGDHDAGGGDWGPLLTSFVISARWGSKLDKGLVDIN